MKYAISNAQARQLLDQGSQDESPFLAHFFFHGRGSGMQRSLQGLLRSILFKVLTRYPRLIPQVLPSQPRKNWPEATLNTAFQKLMTEDLGCRLNIILFIDGLDEFSGNHSNIAESLSTICDRSIHSLRICIASRPLPVFEHRFQRYPRLQLQDQTGRDIALFVTEELNLTESMRTIRAQNRWEAERLTNAVVSKSCGVFLWVRLATRSLVEGLIEGENLQELWLRLGSLPTELDDLFQTMLGHIKPEHLEEAAQMFQLIRWGPTRLYLPLFAFALDSPEVNLACPIQEIPDWELRNICNRAVLRLQSRCAGLIEVVHSVYSPFGDQREVQFLHQSVKDFMELPNNWASLSARNTPDFSPTRSIVGATLRAIKGIGKYRHAHATHTNSFGEAASLAEHVDNQAQTDMLQEFDRVMFTTLNEEWAIVEIGTADMQGEEVEAPQSWMDRMLALRGYPSVPANLLTFAAWANMTVSVASSGEFADMDQAGKNTLLNLKARQAAYPFRVSDSIPMIRYLIQSGADPNAVVLLQSAWQIVLKSAFYQYERGHLTLIETFLAGGADPDATVHFDSEIIYEGQRKHELKHQRADFSPLAVLLRLPDAAKTPQHEHLITELRKMGATERVVLSPFLGYPPCDPRLTSGIHRALALTRYGERDPSPLDLCKPLDGRRHEDLPTRNSSLSAETDTFKMVVSREFGYDYPTSIHPSYAQQTYDANTQHSQVPMPYQWYPVYTEQNLPLRPSSAQWNQGADVGAREKGKGRWRNIFR
jgi:hypothetical protein